MADSAFKPPEWFGPTTRDVLAILSTGLMLIAYGLPWFKTLPDGSAQAIGQLQGAIILQWGGVMSWYFGSSKSSDQKTDTMAVQAQTIAAMTPTVDPKA